MNTLIKGKKVRFADDLLIVELQDGRIIGTPLSCINHYKKFLSKI